MREDGVFFLKLELYMELFDNLNIVSISEDVQDLTAFKGIEFKQVAKGSYIVAKDTYGDTIARNLFEGRYTLKEAFQIACNLGNQCTHIQIGEVQKNHEPNWNSTQADWFDLIRVPRWKDSADCHERWCRFYQVFELKKFPNTNSPNMKIYEVLQAID